MIRFENNTTFVERVSTNATVIAFVETEITTFILGSVVT